jgi:hypothetical protein
MHGHTSAHEKCLLFYVGIGVSYMPAYGYIQPLEKCPRHDRLWLISEELDDEN